MIASCGSVSPSCYKAKACLGQCTTSPAPAVSTIEKLLGQQHPEMEKKATCSLHSPNNQCLNDLLNKGLIFISSSLRKPMTSLVA